MSQQYRIGFAGTDARTLLSAQVMSTAASETDNASYRGVVLRGTSAMPVLAGPEWFDWPVDFLSTSENSTQAYAEAIIQALNQGSLDYVLPLPEALQYGGIVDLLRDSGYGDRIAGLESEAAFIEGDKAECKKLCWQAGIPVADDWEVVDARSYSRVFAVCLDFLHRFGGVVLKYPYSASGKGARIILDAWEIKEVYDTLLADYKKDYRKMFHNRPWPLLIESRMSGVEISFTILVDGEGNFRVLPTSLDYPERYPGPAGKENPITGGMGSISPHPFESNELINMVSERIARPMIEALRDRGILRPCVLYPGCIVSFSHDSEQGVRPRDLRVCEFNIRPGEPEFQAVVRRIRNFGALVRAMFQSRLDRVEPEIREDQIALCTALVTGPGGPDGQKGYPWSVTKYEPVEIDLKYLKNKNLQLVPSGMGYSEERGLYSDGTRVAYLNANGTVGPDQHRGQVADKLANRVLAAYRSHKVRVVPREDPQGNRLDLREDIGSHFALADTILAAARQG
jgi:phosphoribosylamine--glycine ligase